MFKKIALCAMLVLFLAPATVMAAGQQEWDRALATRQATARMYSTRWLLAP